MDYFTADWHLFHANIIKYCKRPFSGTAEMNRIILDRLNERVKKNDWLYFLGDLAFFKNAYVAGAAEDWLSVVQCKNICFIKGNHDIRLPNNIVKFFFWIRDRNKIVSNGQEIVLDHYAGKVWNKCHHGV